mgnify:CR=1 FL=1
MAPVKLETLPSRLLVEREMVHGMLPELYQSRAAWHIQQTAFNPALTLYLITINSPWIFDRTG